MLKNNGVHSPKKVRGQHSVCIGKNLFGKTCVCNSFTLGTGFYSRNKTLKMLDSIQLKKTLNHK